MTNAASTELRKTPLNARHRASQAKMMPFAGWEMPVEYAGITSEHMAVRRRAGLFDGKIFSLTRREGLGA